MNEVKTAGAIYKVQQALLVLQETKKEDLIVFVREIDELKGEFTELAKSLDSYFMK